MIKTVILSRFNKKSTQEEIEIERKRAICKGCEFNSKNSDKIRIDKLILKKLSDFYSLITGNREEDSLGSCNSCGCSIFYKSKYELECPHPKGNKWKK
jgi:hypothetical protein